MDKTNRNTEENIFQLAFEAFKRNVPMQPEYEILADQPHTLIGRYKPDLLVRMTIHGMHYDYAVEAKNIVTNMHIYMLLTHMEYLKHPLLLVTKYVNHQMAEKLRNSGLEFIDTAGNAYINKPPLYIFVKGNRLKEHIGRVQLGRVFKPAGLRMIYAILCNPGLENKTVREIATAANVAVGTVDLIIKELKDQGFLIDMGKQGYKIIQKETLLDRWVTAYPEQLRPKQILGRYKGQPGWWQKINLDPLQTQWGGEVAAARLTQYLNPQIVTIYTAVRYLNNLLIENRLKKDNTGDIEILERFWKPNEKGQYKDLVNPILIYADLLATGDPRNIETAKMIYEEHIVRLVREN